MRKVTHKHLSVIGGLARFAQVTVVELPPESISSHKTVLVLNGHQIDKRSEDEDRFVKTAVQAVSETALRLGWRGSPLRVDKIDSSYVDMHLEAAHLAAVAAATELIEEQHSI